MKRPESSGSGGRGLAVRVWMFGLVALAAVLLLLGCDQTASVDSGPSFSGQPVPAVVEIDTVISPGFWVYRSEEYHTLSLRLDIDTDTMEDIAMGAVIRPSAALYVVPLTGGQAGSVVRRIELHDDGGVYNWADSVSSPEEAAFYDSTSGDLIPGDFDYSIRINSFFAPDSGEYRLIFAVFTDSLGIGADANSVSRSEERISEVTYTDKPVIVSFSVPDSLPSGFPAQTWTAETYDLAPVGDSVAVAELHLLLDGADTGSPVPLNSVGGGVWTLDADASFARGRVTAEYTFALRAWDLFGVEADPLQVTVWMENSAPVVEGFIETPDTLWVPLEPEVEYNYMMSVEVRDLQTSADLESVYYILYDPLGERHDNPEIQSFNDDGVDPDETAGDDIWSVGFKTDSSVSNFGTWSFVVYARDFADNLSDSLTVDIPMIQEGGGQ